MTREPRPIRIFFSPLTQRFYASQYYKQERPGIVVITGKKYDVTSDIGTLITEHKIEFEPDRKSGSRP